MDIWLAGERPISWNKFYSGMHWAKRKELADATHLVVQAAVGPDAEEYKKPVNIRLVAAFKNRPLDADNICAKLYIDGLIHAGVLVDDSPTYVRTVATTSLVDRNRPGLLISIVPAATFGL